MEIMAAHDIDIPASKMAETPEDAEKACAEIMGGDCEWVGVERDGCPRVLFGGGGAGLRGREGGCVGYVCVAVYGGAVIRQYCGSLHPDWALDHDTFASRRAAEGSEYVLYRFPIFVMVFVSKVKSDLRERLNVWPSKLRFRLAVELVLLALEAPGISSSRACTCM